MSHLKGGCSQLCSSFSQEREDSVHPPKPHCPPELSSAPDLRAAPSCPELLFVVQFREEKERNAESIGYHNSE